MIRTAPEEVLALRILGDYEAIASYPLTPRRCRFGSPWCPLCVGSGVLAYAGKCGECGQTLDWSDWDSRLTPMELVIHLNHGCSADRPCPGCRYSWRASDQTRL